MAGTWAKITQGIAEGISENAAAGLQRRGLDMQEKRYKKADTRQAELDAIAAEERTRQHGIEDEMKQDRATARERENKAAPLRQNTLELAKQKDEFFFNQAQKAASQKEIEDLAAYTYRDLVGLYYTATPEDQTELLPKIARAEATAKIPPGTFLKLKQVIDMENKSGLMDARELLYFDNDTEGAKAAWNRVAAQLGRKKVADIRGDRSVGWTATFEDGTTMPLETKDMIEALQYGGRDPIGKETAAAKDTREASIAERRDDIKSIRDEIGRIDSERRDLMGKMTTAKNKGDLDLYKGLTDSLKLANRRMNELQQKLHGLKTSGKGIPDSAKAGAAAENTGGAAKAAAGPAAAGAGVETLNKLMADRRWSTLSPVIRQKVRMAARNGASPEAIAASPDLGWSGGAAPAQGIPTARPAASEPAIPEPSQAMDPKMLFPEQAPEALPVQPQVKVMPAGAKPPADAVPMGEVKTRTGTLMSAFRDAASGYIMLFQLPGAKPMQPAIANR